MNQPQANPNIPENLVKEIDAVRNKITLGESEVLRLKDLVRAETYTVSQLTNSRKALEEEVAELVLMYGIAQKKLESLTKETDGAETELNKVKSTASMVLKELDGLNESKQRLMNVL